MSSFGTIVSEVVSFLLYGLAVLVISLQSLVARAFFPTREEAGPLRPVGEYYKPSASETTGSPDEDKSKAYSRSPCPALNALANHGFIHRDGRGLGTFQVIKALKDVYNLSPILGLGLVMATKLKIGLSLFRSFSLAQFSKHNAIEHDASLVHDDASAGTDPATVNQEFAEQLFKLAKSNQILGVPELATFRKAREAYCAEKNPEYVLNGKKKFLAYGEASLLLNVLGRDESISLRHARSFLVDERIPEDYERPSKGMGLPDLEPTSKKIQDLVYGPKESKKKN